MHLIYLSSARRNLGQIEEYVAQSSDWPTALALTDSLQSKCQRLADLPGTLGTGRHDLGTRIGSTPHGNYVILFRYNEDSVEIVNILHASRDVARQYDED